MPPIGKRYARILFLPGAEAYDVADQQRGRTKDLFLMAGVQGKRLRKSNGHRIATDAARLPDAA